MGDPQSQLASAQLRLEKATRKFESASKVRTAHRNVERNAYELLRELRDRYRSTDNSSSQASIDVKVAESNWKMLADKEAAARHDLNERLRDLHCAREDVQRAQDALGGRRGRQKHRSSDQAHEERRDDARPPPHTNHRQAPQTFKSSPLGQNHSNARQYSYTTQYYYVTSPVFPHSSYVYDSSQRCRQSGQYSTYEIRPEVHAGSEQYGESARRYSPSPQVPSHQRSYTTTYTTHEARPFNDHHHPSPAPQARAQSGHYTTYEAKPSRHQSTSSPRPRAQSESHSTSNARSHNHQPSSKSQRERSPSPPPQAQGKSSSTPETQPHSQNAAKPSSTKIAAWFSKVDAALSDPAKLQRFPSPPAWSCGNTDCVGANDSRVLGACACNIAALFEDRPNLGKERLRWHPDKFSKCPEAWRENFRRKAQEIFVVVDGMYKGR